VASDDATLQAFRSPSFAQELTAYESLRRDFELTEPDRDVIARDMIASKKRLRPRKVNGKLVHPEAIVEIKRADLAASIIGISLDLTMSGAPSLVLTILDPIWRFLDSGFWDVDDNGRLQDIDVNYPDGSRYWWRLHQFSPQSDKSIQVTFLPWVVSALMDQHGPIKADRAKRTRAEFLKSLVDRLPYEIGRPAPEFYCKQLDKKQKIEKVSVQTPTSSSQAPNGKAAKTVGIGANSGGLTIQGQPLGASRLAVANIILQVGDQLRAPRQALIGAIYASMGESGMNPNVSAGVFQTTGDPSKYNGGSDTAGQVHDFYLGVRPFGSPGAIALANAGAPAWVIANQTEVNGAWGLAKYPQLGSDSYGHQWPGGMSQAIAEATAIVDAGGGAVAGVGGSGSTTIEVIQPYYFQINKGEDYWTGMNRLAQEVGWELVVDGSRIYYDADTTLIRQKVAAVVHRDEATTLTWSYDWDNRHLVTNVQLGLLAERFAYHSGEVLKLDAFGPASVGSTVKLPGRWLIGEIQHNVGDAFSTFTLAQPVPPKLEPAPTVTQRTISTGGSAAAGGGGGSGSYINPLPGATFGRTDMGVDGSMPVGTAIVAPGAIRIVGVLSGWYAGQPYIWWELLDGPDKGKYQYVAEQITGLASGTLRQGETICRFAGSGTGFEFGWAASNGQTLAQATTGYSEGQVTPAGTSIRAWLKSVGASV
jgi:hypothetical protein